METKKLYRSKKDRVFCEEYVEESVNTLAWTRP